MVGQQTFGKILLFSLLALNPFVLDYLVVARGYGLAIGFFQVCLACLVLMLSHALTLSSRQILSIAGSLAAGLSFAANFSFAFALLFVLVGTFLVQINFKSLRLQHTLKTALFTFLPGGLLALLLCGSVLRDYQREQLFWGARSFRDLFVDLFDASFALLNQDFVPNVILAPLSAVRGYFPLALLALVLLSCSQLPKFFISKEPQVSNWRSQAIVLLLMVLAATLSAHALQFIWLGIPLPYERTALFLIPLLTIFIFLLLDLPQGEAVRTRLLQVCGYALLVYSAIYYLGCMRDNYFREWSINADIHPMFTRLEQECRIRSCSTIYSHPNYSGSLRFYRKLYSTGDPKQVVDTESLQRNGGIYVLPADQHKEALESGRLKLLQRGALSDYSILLEVPRNPNTSDSPGAGLQ